MTDGPHTKPSTSAGPRFGIMGGTFDPPHLAHLIVAQEAYFQLALERVYFVPTGQPPHKAGHPISAAADRCAMVTRAIADNPTFALSTVEVDRAGPSYTVETLRQLRAAWGATPRLYLILGWDMFLDLPNWYDPEDVVGQVSGLAVIHRPGYDTGDARVAQVTAALPAVASKLVFVSAPQLAISASEVRRRVAVGQPIRYLVPDGVAAFVAEHGLYRAPRGANHAREDAPGAVGGELAGSPPDDATSEAAT